MIHSANELELAKILVEHGADVNAKMSDLHPSTPLHFAVKKVFSMHLIFLNGQGWKEMVSLLLEAGANTSLRKENDLTVKAVNVHLPIEIASARSSQFRRFRND